MKSGPPPSLNNFFGRVCRLVLLAALSAAGCGYHFAAAGSAFPSDVHTIYVARFSNKSRASGIEDELARYLKDEIARHRRLTLVEDPADADLSLTGVIRLVEAAPAGFNAVAEPSIYALNMSVDASLFNRRTGKTLWSGSGIGASNQYAVVPQAIVATSPEFIQQNLRIPDIQKMTDIQVDLTQRSAARERDMSNIARDLYASMAEGF